MDYELAIELKGEGFVFEIIPEGINPLMCNRGMAQFDDGGVRYFQPTLSELIEACGDEIDGLCRVTMGWRAWGTAATDDEEHPTIRKEEYGKTSEEAVARLWLALNKHD